MVVGGGRWGGGGRNHTHLLATPSTCLLTPPPTHTLSHYVVPVHSSTTHHAHMAVPEFKPPTLLPTTELTNLHSSSSSSKRNFLPHHPFFQPHSCPLGSTFSQTQTHSTILFLHKTARLTTHRTIALPLNFPSVHPTHEIIRLLPILPPTK